MNAINPLKQAAAEAKRYDIAFPTLICRATGIASSYKVTKLPHLFIIDQTGVIAESKLYLKSKKIKEVLDRLLPVQAETLSGE